MTNQQAKEMLSYVNEAKYEQAFALGKTALAANPNDPDILGSLYFLTKKLRYEAMNFSNKKANYSATSSAEQLLLEVNELTGQDMYGNFN